MDVIVIGGGPSGMMAAISASQKGKKVLLLEKNSLLGKKLLITGKGRCNVTSSLPIEEFIKNTPGNGKFLYSSYNSFTNKDIINFLEKQGLKLKEERGNKRFLLLATFISFLILSYVFATWYRYYAVPMSIFAVFGYIALFQIDFKKKFKPDSRKKAKTIKC